MVDHDTGIIHTIAGTGAIGFSGDDGSARAAMMWSWSLPAAIVDPGQISQCFTNPPRSPGNLVRLRYRHIVLTGIPDTIRKVLGG